MERKKRFELSTLALARQCSTAELLPQDISEITASDFNLVFFSPKARRPKAGMILHVERKKRFELSTLALARQCSTAELLPHVQFSLTLSRGREGTRTLTISHWLLRPARLPFRHPPEGVVRHQGLEPWAR